MGFSLFQDNRRRNQKEKKGRGRGLCSLMRDLSCRNDLRCIGHPYKLWLVIKETKEGEKGGSRIQWLPMRSMPSQLNLLPSLMVNSAVFARLREATTVSFVIIRRLHQTNTCHLFDWKRMRDLQGDRDIFHAIATMHQTNAAMHHAHSKNSVSRSTPEDSMYDEVH